ncbi:MAG: hypothetical protein ACKVZJ_09295 [Phycisphaerales bacterium]
MDQTLTFIPSPSRNAAALALRRVAWIDDAQVVARVFPEPKMIGPAHVCARLADLRRLARRYRDLRRNDAANHDEHGDRLHSPFSASLPLAG